MKEKKLIPHIVDVTASYRRSVIIMAEDTAQAEELAESLCGNGVLCFTNDDAAECEAVCSGEASVPDFRYYPGVYNESGKLPISSHGYLLTKAIRLINEYLRDSFGADTEKVDTSRLEDVPLASTDYEEPDEFVPVTEPYNVSVKADLLRCQIKTYINGVLVDTRSFKNMEVFCNEELAHLNFDDLICLENDDWLNYLGKTVHIARQKTGFYSSKTVNWIKGIYRPGLRIKLTQMMDGICPVEAGTFGTVAFVDDAGHLHMHWDNGRTLALVPGVDRFTIVNSQIQRAI